MTSHLRDDGTYRGVGGPGQQKSRAQRAKELFEMLDSEDDRDIIVCLWEEVQNLHLSTSSLNCSADQPTPWRS